MIRRNLTYFLFIVTMCFPHVVSADNYNVTVTRNGSNIYKVDSSDVIIVTRNCYVIAYSGKAVLNSTGFGGEFIFTDSHDKCSVKAVFGRSTSFQGEYDVQLNHKADDWYEIVESNMYIKTSKCQTLAHNQSATVVLKSGGWGEITFEDSTGCTVEGVYTQLQL